MRRWRAIAFMVLLTGVAASGYAAAPESGPLDGYRAAGQKLLRDEIAPALARAAPSVGATRAPTAEVTASRDPLDVGVEVDRAGARRLTVSAGFLVFLDSLIEAEVSARLLKREDLLPAYRDDVVRYAGVATRKNRGPNPGRFFRRLGIGQAEYDALLASRAYQESRSNNMVQSLAWIAAHRLTVGETATGGSATSASDRAAAEWAWAAGFAPFPLPGAAMLYFAALDPSETEMARVRCRAQGALEASLRDTRSAARTPGRLPRPVSEAQLDRWASMIAGTAAAGSCGGAAAGAERRD